jgi:hypothetical protein
VIDQKEKVLPLAHQPRFQIHINDSGDADSMLPAEKHIEMNCPSGELYSKVGDDLKDKGGVSW